MKRNFFRILTAAVLCCAMLAGLCLTASAEPVKLVVATWDGGNNDQMQRTLADAFTEKTGIEVEYLSLSSDTSEYKDKLAMMLNAQTYLDCAFRRNHYEKEFLSDPDRRRAMLRNAGGSLPHGLCRACEASRSHVGRRQQRSDAAHTGGCLYGKNRH